MSDKPQFTLPVEHVSDTAWLVAQMRLMESERPDAHFDDRIAKKLLGMKGKQLIERLRNKNEAGFILAVRTKVIDELLLKVVKAGADTILNLAAGLDTRTITGWKFQPTSNGLSCGLPGGHGV